MTTPEAFRRRQLIEGVILILIGCAMAVQSAVFYSNDAKQRDCLEENFIKLSIALDKRSDLEDRAARAAERINLAELEVKTNAEFLNRLKEYKAEMNELQRLREQNPVPPYPVGEC